MKVVGINAWVESGNFHPLLWKNYTNLNIYRVQKYQVLIFFKWGFGREGGGGGLGRDWIILTSESKPGAEIEQVLMGLHRVNFNWK